MGKSLYLDTTGGPLKLGLLNEDCSWKSYCEISELKTSRVLHSQIKQILEEFDISWEQLEKIIFPAGPGSYTGTRVSEVVAETLTLSDLDWCSFYHFEVPHWVFPECSYQWVSRAFKGEIFVAQYKEGAFKTELVSEESFRDNTTRPIEESIYLSFDQDYFEKRDFPFSYCSTHQLVKDYPESIFPFILKRDRKEEIFYYRDEAVEFRIS